MLRNLPNITQLISSRPELEFQGYLVQPPLKAWISSLDAQLIGFT